jgi:hypothetical protein
MEIINGLEEMNDQLAEEVKSAKKDRRVALKLYDKSKDANEKLLHILQLEKEEKNVLKDELTQAFKMHESQQNEIACLLNMQQARQQVIEEYKSMIDGLKLSKLNLKREVKLGRRGGASWPLWVTEVSCLSFWLMDLRHQQYHLPLELCLPCSTAKSLKQFHR